MSVVQPLTHDLLFAINGIYCTCGTAFQYNDGLIESVISSLRLKST